MSDNYSYIYISLYKLSSIVATVATIVSTPLLGQLGLDSTNSQQLYEISSYSRHQQIITFKIIMGHGHHDPNPGWKIPDASVYKLEDAPYLVRLQEEFAKKGLKDPWARNHIWKYHPKYGTITSRWFTMLFRGFRVGLAAFIVTLGVERALGIKDYHPHGHDDEEHGEGHGEHH
ncbi:NADH dehydrogenase [ubiquinone] 1 beta subcomplex subunit 3 isoform X2 [Venturia canescens]|uniref:NADH dehydrogenase [ubiquinone] 1 beta subcomplex subunit 3 isoform X2 n=1 Tax=Venturia canescens TaxID=32260 RepID=UPI001C9CC271|nr:NADH dehydrogenase [ubiquinone] 1 beta subcomplex subunit 3 isoform X2 [Venturia canescens]